MQGSQQKILQLKKPLISTRENIDPEVPTNFIYCHHLNASSEFSRISLTKTCLFTVIMVQKCHEWT